MTSKAKAISSAISLKWSDPNMSETLQDSICTEYQTMLKETFHLILDEIKGVRLAMIANRGHSEQLCLADKLRFSVKNFLRLIEGQQQTSAQPNTPALIIEQQRFMQEMTEFIELCQQGNYHLTPRKLKSWEQHLTRFFNAQSTPADEERSVAKG
jgi:hypothetical protein